jgi:2,4-dichlorophenol 6-monooxygenase
MTHRETDVLIVGTGPAGSSSAALLSTYGVKNIIINKYGWTAPTPRAHITNQRTMEVMRDLGLEPEVAAHASPQEIMGNNVFCTSLAGEEIGRLHSWGTHPRRQADYDLASPTRMCDIPQNLLEPILVSTAAARGSRAIFNTEYLSLEQDDDGVTATVRDRITGETGTIRAKYLLGADGGRSKVAEDIGLPMEGQMAVAGSMNIVFNADLSRYVAHRPSVLYWVLQPGSSIGGIGMGLVRMVRPWNEWLIVWGYDINGPEPVLTDDEAIRIVHNLVGDDTIAVKIRSTSIWTNNKMYATEYARGRVFCLGDAVHRHPPSNGLGSNTSIQDSFNLAWKLALVLKGQANPSLLETYDTERAPIGRQIVLRANQSIEEFGGIFDALGLLGSQDPNVMKANMAARKDSTPEAATQRQRLRDAIDFKSYEFNCHGVELNQRYRSSAIQSDGTPEPVFERDAELYYQPTTWPGARLPHAWLHQGTQKVSTLDLTGKGRFSLLTGLGGEGWIKAAKATSEKFGLEINVIVIGPGQDVDDLYGEWNKLREIEDSGCILVRPDHHVAYRTQSIVPDPSTALIGALEGLLGVG